MTGAENHNPYGNAGAGYDTTLYPEGDYYNRINNAMQAWYEYFPIREPSASLLATTTAFNAALSTYIANATGAALAFGYTSVQTIAGSPVTNLTALTRARIANQQRTFNFGGLLTYVLTEDRAAFRTSGETALNNGQYEALGGFDCPACPGNSPSCLAVQAAQYGAAITNFSYQLPAAFPTQCSPQLLGLLISGMITTNFKNWTGAQVAQLNALHVVQALEAFQAYNGNMTEHLIGTQAAIYIGAQFAQSKAAGVPYQAWASQTVFQPTSVPDLINSTAKGRISLTAPATGQYLLNAICGNAGFAPSCAGGLAGFEFEADNWDGFNSERNFVLQMLALGNTPIINSGDSHSFWLGTVANATYGNGPTAPLAVEFASGSVTAYNFGDAFPSVVAPGYTLSAASNGFFNWIEDGHLIAAQAAGQGLKAVRHMHGALVFKVTPTSYIGQVFVVDTLNSTSYNAQCDYAYSVAPGAKGVMTSLATGTTGFTATPGCVSTINGTVPGTFYLTTQGGLPLVAGLPQQQTLVPIPSPPPPPPPSPPPPTVATVSTSVSLQGVTSSSFTPAVQAVFVSTLASQLGVSTGAITVTGVTSSRRHLLSGVTVAFTVSATSVGAATGLFAQINTVCAGTGATAFAGALTAALAANPATSSVSVSGVILVSAPTIPGAPGNSPGKVQPWNAHKKISIGLGVGLGLGLGLPLIVTVVYCCKPKPAGGKSTQGEPATVAVVAVPVIAAQAPSAV